MDWKDISGAIGKYAPMVGTLIGGPAGTALGSVVSAALGTENTPEAVNDFIMQKPTEAQTLLKQVQEKNKHQYEMMLLEMQKTAIKEQAKTQRAELKSKDPFIARWRPTYGYILALSFLIWSSAFSYLLIKIIDEPADMAAVVTSVSQLMGPMSVVWGMALAVLGVNVHSRSKDKQTDAGHPPAKGGLLSFFSKDS